MCVISVSKKETNIAGALLLGLSSISDHLLWILQGVGPSFVEPVNPNEGQEILDALSNFRGMVGNPQMNPITEQPHVEILEQPIPNKLRFR